VQAEQHSAAAIDRGDTPLQFVKPLLDVTQQGLAMRGQGDVAAVPMEQRRLKRGFQPPVWRG